MGDDPGAVGGGESVSSLNQPAVGLGVDHTTIFRWTQRYAPEINKRMRPHLKLAGASHRIDETYVKDEKQWKYLYHAVDREGRR